MRKFRELPSQSELLSRFNYDQTTGEMRWRWRSDMSPQWNGKMCGKVAGGLRKTGYVTTDVDGAPALCHRIIWKMMTGEDAPRDIDHKDGNGTNNRWSNLRLATKDENLRNSKPHKGKALPKGVSLHACGRYIAGIYVNKRRVHLGLFDDPKIAHAAYCAAATKHFGEFARMS